MHPQNNRLTGMALVAFIRGVNVGGYRTFRPSVLAKELSDYDVVNVGAAGTFVIRKLGSRAKFRAELIRKLPFKAELALCDGRDLLSLERDSPFGAEPPHADIVRFVGVLPRAVRLRPQFPITIPADGEWFVRILGLNKQFAFGEYRRHMKTISYLGRVDKIFSVPATIRNWNTIGAVVRILKAEKKGPTHRASELE